MKFVSSYEARFNARVRKSLSPSAMASTARTSTRF
jgi:hypothetical protein